MSNSAEVVAGRTMTTRSAILARALGLVNVRVLSMLLVFAVLTVFFHVYSGGVFVTPRNLSNLLRQTAIDAILSAGVSLLMIMGEIDLSIGSAVFLCSVVAGTLQVDYGMSVLPTVLLTILAGLVLGAWQGFWVVRISVPSFIVTLAGLLAFRGLGLTYTGASTLAPMQRAFVKLSEGFIPPGTSYILLAVVLVVSAALLFHHSRRVRGSAAVSAAPLLLRLGLLVLLMAALAWVFGGFRGIPDALLWVVVSGSILWVVMTRSKFGRNAYMIGANREASNLAGIDIKGQLFGGFLIMGALYGVAGVLITARLSASTPNTGTYLELDAIAAAVIGGTSLRGGIGTVPGAMAGAVLLATLDNGMSIMNISSFVQLMVKGGVLLVALASDSYAAKRRVIRG